MAMLCRALYCHGKLSVCLSVTLRYRGHRHIGCNSSKIILRPISLAFFISGDPNITDLLQILAGIGVQYEKWLWAYKTGNIPEMVADKAKVTIDGLCKVVHGLSIAAKMYDLE